MTDDHDDHTHDACADCGEWFPMTELERDDGDLICYGCATYRDRTDNSLGAQADRHYEEHRSE